MHYKVGVVLFEWIAGDAELANAVASWDSHIALDTEFIRTNTYYPMPGLYQVAAGSRVFLIDPLSVENWQPFVDYLADSNTTKIMHACLEDLELLHHHLGVNPRNIFDTQYANAFVSSDFSLSYAALVERLLGVSLQKHETRSNWLQRPLSDEQIKYAVEDVTFLMPLYQALNEGLSELGRVNWFAEDMIQRGLYQLSETGDYYQNIKKAWQLSGQKLAALKALCAWREETARRENVPRNRVIWDDHLFGFACIDQLTLDHVQQALPKGVARRYSSDLVDRHRQGREDEAPQPLPKPLSSGQGARVKVLREVGLAVAGDLNMAPELIARKKDLESCVRHHAQNAELSPHYSSWREPLVGDAFLAVLQEESEV